MRKIKSIVSVFVVTSFAFGVFTTVNAHIAGKESAAAGIKVCPGSGASCVLWGLVSKGADQPIIEFGEPGTPAPEPLDLRPW